MGHLRVRAESDDPIAALQAARSRIDEVAADLRVELAGIVSAASVDAPDDEHDVEGSSIGFERARVTALLRSTEVQAEAVRRALLMARAGLGPTCQLCHAPIPTERLAALPGVSTCIGCAAASIRHRQLPGR